MKTISGFRAATLASSVAVSFLCLPAFGLNISDSQDLAINVGLAVEQDSNILANSFEIDDTLIKPSLEAAYSNYSGVVATEFSAGVDVGRYSGFDELNYEDFSLIGSLSYPNRIADSIAYEVEAAYVERTTAVAEEGTQVETNYITIGGVIEVPYSEKFESAFSAVKEKREAKTSGFEDQDIDVLGVDMGYVYSSKMDLFLSYRYRATDIENIYEGLRRFDSTDHAFSVGAEGDFSDKLVGRFQLGFQQRSFDDALYEDDDAPFFDISLTWDPVEKTSFIIGANSDYGSTGTGLSTETITFSLGWKQTINQKFSASLGVDFIDGTYTRLTGSREDEQLNWSGRLDYIFAETGTLYLMGVFGDRSSEVEYFDYKRDQVSLGIDYSF